MHARARDSLQSSCLGVRSEAVPFHTARESRVRSVRVSPERVFPVIWVWLFVNDRTSDATPKADPIGLPGRPPLSPGRPALGPGQIQRQRPAELRILQRQRIRSRRRTPTSRRRVISLFNLLIQSPPNNYYVTIKKLKKKIPKIILTLTFSRESQNCLWQMITNCI